MKTVFVLVSALLLVLLVPQHVPGSITVLTSKCNMTFPDIQCGSECSFNCLSGFSCKMDSYCSAGTCGSLGYCNTTVDAEYHEQDDDESNLEDLGILNDGLVIEDNDAADKNTVEKGTSSDTNQGNNNKLAIIQHNPTKISFASAVSKKAPSKNGGSGSPASTLKGLGQTCATHSSCISSLKCFLGKCQRYWEAPNFNDGMFSSKWKVIKSGHGEKLRKVVTDPAGGSNYVLQVAYPANSRNPSGPVEGGTGIYVRPMDVRKASTVTFEYQVYFESKFDYVLGGKLPGLFGGSMACSGGSAATNCFSTRYMWRAGGAGEVYLYADKKAQLPNFCSLLPNTICNEDYGWSLARGQWTFNSGAWNTVRQTVKLNSFDSKGKYLPNGVMTIWFNNNPNPAFYHDKIVYRTKPGIGVEGLTIETFFGGNDDDYKTPRLQHTYFKGFKLAAH